MSIALNHRAFDDGARDGLVQEFYDRWQEEALVVDLWFALQAQSERTGVERLQQLEAHAAFDLKNPNRARSVIAVFGMQNHRNFHALDGSGYEYLKRAIQRVDSLNPQLSARLATPLSRWQRYDVNRQRLMQGALQDLVGSDDISKDLYEIVSKSLAEA